MKLDHEGMCKAFYVASLVADNRIQQASLILKSATVYLEKAREMYEKMQGYTDNRQDSLNNQGE